jgi:O-antigen ligase
LPLICAYQQPPLPAFFNQALAVALWSVVLFLLTLSRAGALRVGNMQRTIATFLSPVFLWALLLAALLGHTLAGLTPGFIAAPIAINLALALLLSAAFSIGPRDAPTRKQWLQALLVGIMVASLFNAVVALVQMAAPGWADDMWIARTAVPHDRASGNLRQPNQLATLMVWGLLATSYFWRRQPVRWLVFSVPLLATLVATGSRTGMVSLLLIAIVALLRSRRVRLWRAKGWLALLLVVAPLAWIVGSIFTRSTANAALSQRLALWRDVLEMISQHPWFGVGWGQLNFAWTLTPLAGRAADVFDHAHSLPLQLAAELGVPLAALVMLLLGALLWRTRSALRGSDGATVMLLLATVLLHSLFEYPLWFSYFLLPSAALLAWLVCFARAESGQSSDGVEMPRSAWLHVSFKVAAALSIAGVAFACNEYQKAMAIHRAVGRPVQLARAIEIAQRSPLFGHFGDYAAIMTAGDAAAPAWFNRPIRHVLDERLLSAYARMLARTGDSERAAFVVARAREFQPDATFDNLPSVARSAPAFTTRDFRR